MYTTDSVFYYYILLTFEASPPGILNNNKSSGEVLKYHSHPSIVIVNWNERNFCIGAFFSIRNAHCNKLIAEVLYLQIGILTIIEGL